MNVYGLDLTRLDWCQPLPLPPWNEVPWIDLWLNGFLEAVFEIVSHVAAFWSIPDFLRGINLCRKSFDGLKELPNLKFTVKPAQAQALACKTGFTKTLVPYLYITRFLGHSPSLTDAWAACSLQLSQSRRDKSIVASNIAGSGALLCNNWKKNKIMKLRMKIMFVAFLKMRFLCLKFPF